MASITSTQIITDYACSSLSSAVASVACFTIASVGIAVVPNSTRSQPYMSALLPSIASLLLAYSSPVMLFHYFSPYNRSTWVDIYTSSFQHVKFYMNQRWHLS